jgi:hypothetical protein
VGAKRQISSTSGFNDGHLSYLVQPQGRRRDTEVAESASAYLNHLKGEGAVTSYRITRRKLGLALPQLPQRHITLDFENMAQMDGAFSRVSSRADPVESFHHAVNSKVQDIFLALFRDFPIPAG